MKLTLFKSDKVGDKTNCRYPTRVEVTNEQEMKDAVAFDHVCAEYTNNYRSASNFVSSNVIVMDCDNDHSEDPADWITEDKLKDLFPGVCFVAVPSRHHMVAKDGKAARPKYHVYFTIKEITEADKYAALKAAIYKAYDFFDSNALDAARFLFGASNGDVVWQDEWMNIDDDVVIDEANEFEDMCEDDYFTGTITEGNRNNYMSRFAARILIRFGETDEAYEMFENRAHKCDPPLEDKELKAIWYSALKFYRKKVVGSDGYIPPDDFNNDFQKKSLKPEDFSDIGEAKVLVKEYGGELAYSDSTDFMRYDGIRWVEDKLAAYAAVEEFLDLQFEDARLEKEAAVKALVAGGIDEKTVRAGGKALEKQIDVTLEKQYLSYVSARNYYNFVLKYRNYRNYVNAMNAAKPMIAVKVTDLDVNEFDLNTPAGTYNLAKGLDECREHSAGDLITKVTLFAPGDEGEDIWLDALNIFFCNDSELIEYVQKIIGVCAVGKVYWETIFMAIGSGRNGKSTLFNAIAKVLGDYSGTMSSEALTAGCKRNIMPEISELKGKRLVIAAELEEGTKLSTSTLKKISSIDPVHCEPKYLQPYNFIPSHHVVLYSNWLPSVGATDDGTWRRLLVIPFNAKIEGNADIKNYSDYLVENAGPAIMSWIIEGAKKAIEDEFKIEPPQIVIDAVSAYRDKNDWFSKFMEECCEEDDLEEVKSSELYDEFRAYCFRVGEQVRNSTDFAGELDKRGFIRKKKKTGMWVQGIKLKDDDVDF